MELNAIAFRDDSRIVYGRGLTYYIVTTAEEEKEYEFVASVAMRSYRYIYGAMGDPAAYLFEDQNGILVINPKETA